MRVRKRRLLLTAILILALIAAGIWAAMRAHTAREQADFLASLTTSGGSVTMDYEAEGRQPPRVLLWLPGVFGDWPLAHVERVKVASSDDLRAIGQCENLRELDCADAYVDENEMKSICRCKHLQVLNLGDASISKSARDMLGDLPELVSLDMPAGGNITYGSGRDEANTFNFLKRTPQLRSLRVVKPDIDDNGLRRLRYLKQLEELDLQRANIEGSGLSALANMKHLRKLDLHQTRIDGQYTASLQNLESLEYLDLGETRVNDAAMLDLAGLKNLKWLNVRDTYVRGRGLRRLYCLKQLKVRIELDAEDMEDVDGAVPIVSLKISNSTLTDNGIDHLTQYPMLEELDLSFTNMDDAHAGLLAELTKLKKLDLSKTQVSDAALEHLRGLKELRELHVSYTRVTAAGKEKLRAALPQVKFDGEK
jgi:Leucine-rich repeat (LRR) protein